MPASLGSVTKHIFENQAEAHKLHLEFVVNTAQVVNYGDPVILATNGNVQAAATAAPAHTVIGISIHAGVATDRVTVAMKAYCVVWGESEITSLNAEPVMLGPYNATTGYREFNDLPNVSPEADNTVCVGHCLTPVAADGELVKVALLR